MQQEKVIIVGAGPCGMSCAIELQKFGYRPLVIEKENIVNAIYNFPTHQTFFSSSEKLEIGDVAFITEKHKPVRNQALAYYRSVAERKQLRINTFEEVTSVKKTNNGFHVRTEKQEYEADNVVIATGYYGQPNMMGIPGEELDKVMHYFKEGHPYFRKRVVVIGGKNSAVDAALELHKAGAEVTVIYRGSNYSESIKPWILPEFDSLVRKEEVNMIFNGKVCNVTEEAIVYEVDGETKTIPNDYVFAMTGYRPDISLLTSMGVEIDKDSGMPRFNERNYETNIPGIYIAGVVAAGFNNNKIFIENGRFHGEAIAKSIHSKS
ncbi:MAG: YpdA family putative bacillithiol disulfide reductase [Bacillota bacterium]|uniref:YpdA family putative bacillithiol disulfide reductase n=1 Tax=Virgibacillus salarius TaxID=447199 RepID=A0A941DU57_9BACI|nr:MULTISPECIES: YpdA family putative bacillithiol disulfide reductase [Bacillaceae]NAZ08245.1 YpdA family putative bacillithiol disulfide reductase [Agaribacter marinus]MBR7795532.1 YpdA family putative bacillithiol disulfide reductase [Virgibacillus salarius]MCC2249042.1 YpdA family putative bacillithiol disulfide reductase [Virgibacillus sp. AGTR]MDY7043402.1 YpdA family putative bacillithiol disulfide reductase [Virgibacillus sp. M23]QRZ16994.1 YpdA family putative bacillithiol disulfide r